MDPDVLDRMVTQVRELCTDPPISDIRTDLKKTKSVEMTINRILDGSVRVRPLYYFCSLPFLKKKRKHLIFFRHVYNV